MYRCIDATTTLRIFTFDKKIFEKCGCCWSCKGPSRMLHLIIAINDARVDVLSAVKNCTIKEKNKVFLNV